MMAGEQEHSGGCAGMAGLRAVGDAQGARDFYRFLATCFLYEPSQDLVSAICCDEVLDGLETVFGPAAIGSLRSAVPGPCEKTAGAGAGPGEADDRSPDAIRLDYHALFKTPAGRYVTPYESVYVDRRLVDEVEADGLMMGPAYRKVREFMTRHGFDLSDESDEPADYVGNELQLCAELCDLELRATERGDADGAASWRTARRSFLRDHLATWLPALAERVHARAQGGFYPAVADIAAAFVRHDLEELGERSANREG